MITILSLIAAGAAAGTGLWLLWLTITGTTIINPPKRRPEAGDIAAWIGAAIVGLVMLAVTGWITASALIAIATVLIPSQLRRIAGQQQRTSQAEALNIWIDQVRDLVNAGQAIEPALTATAKWAPEAIRPELRRFVADVRSGADSEDALRTLAESFGSGAATRVVVALIATQRAPAEDLSELLSRLAKQSRDVVALERSVFAERRRFQTQSQVVSAIAVVLVIAIAVFSPDLISTYSDGLIGELKQMLVAMIFIGGFVAMGVMNKVEAPGQFRLREIPGSTRRRVTA